MKLFKAQRSKMIVLIVALCVSHYSCGTKSASTPCEKNIPFTILRDDSQNKRLFVRATEVELSDTSLLTQRLSEIDSYIENCKTDWNDEWTVSFFSERKFAGYKDEKPILELVKDGSWQKNYLAEFNKREGVLTRFPSDPERSKVEKVEY